MCDVLLMNLLPNNKSTYTDAYQLILISYRWLLDWLSVSVQLQLNFMPYEYIPPVDIKTEPYIPETGECSHTHGDVMATGMVSLQTPGPSSKKRFQASSMQTVVHEELSFFCSTSGFWIFVMLLLCFSFF